MNSLEETLQLSRNTEISGLQPPAGGWDAVQKQLNNTPPATPPSSGAAGLMAKPWWLWSLAAITVAAAIYFTAPAMFQQSQTALNEEAAETSEPSIAGSAELQSIAAASEAAEMADQKAVASGAPASTTGTSVPTASPTRIETSTREAAPPVAQSAVVQKSNGAPVKNGEPAEVLPFGSSTAVGLPADESAVRAENQTGSVPSGTLPAGQEETNISSEPRTAPGVSENAPLPNQEATATNGPGLSTSASQFESRTATRAADVLPAAAVSFLEIAEGPLPTAAPAFPPSPPKYARNGKLKVRGETQLHGSLSGHYIPSFRNSRFYTRNNTTGGSSRLFVFPDGEPLPVRFDGATFASTRNLRRNIRLDLGLSRQTGSGFLFRATGGIYYGSDSRPSDNFGELSGTQVREDYYQRELVVPVEVGVQYTFRKRHRFRPYLGVNAIGYLHYSGVERYTFFDAQTQRGGTVSEFRSRGVNFGEIDFAVTSGFQYRFTQQWSAGINLYGHLQGFYFLESPFGVEIRYSLK